MRVGLTYNLRSEHRQVEGLPEDYFGEFDSEETIEALASAIASAGYEVVRIGNIRNLVRFLANDETLDLVFNIAEGLGGRSREAQVPSLLEAFQIPYTFSDPMTLCLCLDKGMTKLILQSHGLPTPTYATVSNMDELKEIRQEAKLGFPLFVKPVHEGTSKGISSEALVRTDVQLASRVKWILSQYDQPVLIETYLPGREFTVGILGNGTNARVIGVTEVQIVDRENSIYGFVQKEEWESRVRYVRVEESSLATDLASLALRAYQVLGCLDAGRVDLRLDMENVPQILEVNPLPGLHPTRSDLPIIASQNGLRYEDLLAEIVDQALRRYQSR